MKNKCVFFSLMILGFLLIIPQSVMAETITLDPGSAHSNTYELRKGETISWNWKIPGEGYVDFWIVDEQGNKFNEIQNQDESSGSFEVPETGSWSAVIKNNDQYTVTIDYDVSVDDGRAFPFFLVLLPIIIMIVILLLLLMIKNKQRMPPKEDT